MQVTFTIDLSQLENGKFKRVLYEDRRMTTIGMDELLEFAEYFK